MLRHYEVLKHSSSTALHRDQHSSTSQLSLYHRHSTHSRFLWFLLCLPESKHIMQTCYLWPLFVTVLSLCNFSLCGKTLHLSLNYATGKFCVFVSYMKEMKVNTDEITAKSLNICKPSLAQEGSRFECVSLTSLFLHFFSSFLLHWTNRTNCHWEHMSDIKPSSFSDLGTALIWLLQETSKHIFEPVASDSLCWFKEWTQFSATPTKTAEMPFPCVLQGGCFIFLQAQL